MNRKLAAGLLLCVICSCERHQRPMPPREQSPMDLVPGGLFVVGCAASEPDCPGNNPRRSVRIDSFWIDRYEASEDAYTACIVAGACNGTKEASDFPVGIQTIEEARSFCQWRGARLPTSVEWEAASRGQDARPFPWGAGAPTCVRAEFSGCSLSQGHTIGNYLQPIGRHPSGVGPYGTHDLAGNADEWTECEARDGPSCVGVIRGGSSHSGVEDLRSYAVHVVDDKALTDVLYIGIRCARGDDWPGRQ